ncbi:MAG: GGDEF domain-containing protein [Legionellaceae bacterium]|nr:GGDEF domain-containing protein [Legionellaceae bacterium]
MQKKHPDDLHSKMHISARYGGEELAVIMPQCLLEDAEHVAERLCRAVEKMHFSDDISITVSIGVSCMSDSTNSQDRLIECADLALYQAKEKGKNRVLVYAEHAR